MSSGVSKTIRKQAKERSRQALIEAGMRLFRDQGLDGPSLDAICAEAGYTRGAFYGHFADREAFLVAVMTEVGGPIVEMFAGAGDDEGVADIAARFLRGFVDGSYPLGPAGGSRPHQLFAACARSPALREHYVALVGDAIDRLETAIEADKSRGRLRQDIDAEALASAFLLLVVGGQALAEIGAPIDFARTSTALFTLIGAAQ